MTQHLAISCIVDQSPFIVKEDHRKYIDARWNELKGKKPFLFDGRIFHVKAAVKNPRQIIIYLATASFADYIVSNTAEFKIAFEKASIVKPLSVGTILLTDDNKWIIGRRKNTADYEGFFSLIAGYMDPDKDLVNSLPDPVAAIKREITEETGIDPNDICNPLCLGFDTSSNNPYIGFITSVKSSFERIKNLNPADNEFENFISRYNSYEIINEFLTENQERITPISKSNISMYLDYLRKNRKF